MLLSTASAVWGKAWPILIAILFFGLIIFSHELGHFTIAKIFKVKINEFSMGMGPVLFKKKGKETQYSLRLFPIGGFVSMEGEDEESQDDRAFCKKPVWQRFLIVLAGATVNLLFGFLLVAIMVTQRNLVPTNTYLGANGDSALVNSSLQKGDRIIKINGRRIYTDSDISFMMMRDEDGVMDLVVKRDGKKINLDKVKFTTTESNGKVSVVYDLILLGKEKNPLTVGLGACKETVSIARIVWISLGDLISGKYGLNELSGPIGTVGFIADAAEQSTQVKGGWLLLINIMAFITINIGVFNLLPVPALDGGRLFFMLIEMVFRKPIPAKYENWVHAVGLVALLAFMAVVSFSDIFKLIRG